MKTICTLLACFTTVSLGTLQAAPLASFALQDVNKTLVAGSQVLASPRGGSVVSPLDYRGRVTVYYFGQEN